MLKMEKEYIQEFGDIPKEYCERIDLLLKESNLSRYQLSVYTEMKRIHKINWKSFKYTIYLLPKATPRPRSGKNGIFYVKGEELSCKRSEEFLRKLLQGCWL